MSTREGPYCAIMGRPLIVSEVVKLRVPFNTVKHLPPVKFRVRSDKEMEKLQKEAWRCATEDSMNNVKIIFKG